MLERFLDKAASPHALTALPPNPLLQGLTSLGRQRLQQDLDLLANCRTLPTGWPDTVPVLVVQGERDAVVPEESAQQLIDAHHLLPGVNGLQGRGEMTGTAA